MTGRRTAASILPGVLLVATFADDPVFGSAIAGMEVAMGPWGLLAATLCFTTFSLAASVSTLWAVRTAPVRLSERVNKRLERVRHSRIGTRIALIDDHHPLTTVLAATVLGSVAPIVLATIGNESRHVGMRTAVVAGLAYGITFSSAYGLVGTVINLFV